MKYFLVICALFVTGLNFAGAKELPTKAITMEVKSMGVKDAVQALLLIGALDKQHYLAS